MLLAPQHNNVNGSEALHVATTLKENLFRQEIRKLWEEMLVQQVANLFVKGMFQWKFPEIAGNRMKKEYEISLKMRIWDNLSWNTSYLPK